MELKDCATEFTKLTECEAEKTSNKQLLGYTIRIMESHIQAIKAFMDARSAEQLLNIQLFDKLNVIMTSLIQVVEKFTNQTCK